MTNTLVNLRLEDREIETLDRMAGKALNRQAVARMLLIAALEAIEENGGRIALPPKFVVSDNAPFVATSFRINEPKGEKRK